jgi:hypothetical protein
MAAEGERAGTCGRRVALPGCGPPPASRRGSPAAEPGLSDPGGPGSAVLSAEKNQMNFSKCGGFVTTFEYKSS